MRQLAAVAALSLVALAGCKRQDMYTQQSSRNWDRNTFFDNQSSMRHPVAGTVARDAPNPPVEQPKTIGAAMLARGKERFEIFCTPCHGRAGNGEGMIVQRGFPHPPSFVEGKLREAPAKVFYNAITNGYGVMYSFSTRVSPADRWAIISYIRALQLSQNTQVAALPPPDQAKLGTAAQ